MQFKTLLSIVILLNTSIFVFAQSTHQPSGQLSGLVKDGSGETASQFTVKIEGTQLAQQTDIRGRFFFKDVAPGDYVVIVTAVGYESQKTNVKVISEKPTNITILIKEQPQQMKQVTITGVSDIKKVRLQGFHVDVVDAKKIANRNVDVNRLLSSVAGIRVRESGGMGSDFNYSINGLSGKAVKFFINGIPMESFGTSFSINNLPINLIERIEVYKGATPVELGGDALGGSINIITNKTTRSFVDFSHSYGSFNTHRSTAIGQWRAKNSGFTTSANIFRNSSDNNYKVSGPTVEISGPGGNPIAITARRFNDKYVSTSAQLETGFTNVKWADQLMIGLNGSWMDQGVQTGQTMAYVFGEVSRNEKFLMPSLKYSKKNFLTEDLQVDLFSSYNRLEATTVDTSSRRYDWAQQIVDSTNGEMGGIGAQKSILTFTDRTQLHRLNAAYKLSELHALNFNYTYSSTTRKGSDPLAATYTIPYRSPQNLNKQVLGVSYQLNDGDKKWTNTFFIKNYSYTANTQNGSTRINNQLNKWGYGYATRYIFSQNLLFKISGERSVRLPEAEELFGNGYRILIAPALKPETSYNGNLGIQFHKNLGEDHIAINTAIFYRNTANLMMLAAVGYSGRSNYENIVKTKGTGFETELIYKHRNWLEFSGNFTFQNIRNNQKYDPKSGTQSIIYKDRLRNTPYLMSNAEVRLMKPQLFGKNNNGNIYLSANYVHQYYLNSPKMGAEGKSTIPMQFTSDLGATYSLSNNRYNISLECRNIFDKPVYDNYLLQKPGRFFSIKTRYFISI